MDKGYPKSSAIRFVSDHYLLLQAQRFVLTRIIVESKTARARRIKIQTIKSLKGKDLIIDGYNVLITVESILSGKPIYLCDDWFHRDIQGIFKKYRIADLTMPAIDQIFNLLESAQIAEAIVMLDQQISMSGTLASMIGRIMQECNIPGFVRTVKDVDRQLKNAKVVIATADGNVIDSVNEVVDLPGEIAKQMKILPYTL